MQRNAIYNALLTQLMALQKTPYSVQTVSRGFVHYDECPASAQPAVYIVPRNENGIYKRGLPTKWLIELDLYIYVKWTDSVNQGVEVLTQVMDGVDYILSPVGPNGGQTATGQESNAVNTLNGIAQYCALQGAAEISGGFLNKSQTIARMPVEIMIA